MSPSAKTAKPRKTTDTAQAAPAKKTTSAPAVKREASPPAVKPQAKPAAKPAARPQNSQEAMLARVEQVRMSQREEGSFDCFGRAGQGFCDQGDCAYHAECLSVSRLLHSL